MLSEAQRFWDAIVGKVRKVAQEVTKNTFRCERYTVTTAPNGTKMGVTLPMGSKEIFLPYSREVASATVGSQVLVVWWFSMSNAKVYFFADGYDGSAYKVYNTTRDLGFTSGTATIAGVSAAMPAPSILICDSNEFVSTDLPSSFFGVIEIKKTWANNARTVINAYGKFASRGDYRMFTNTDSDVPTGTWVYLGQDVDFKIYNSVADLGLTVGSATIAGAYAALAANQMLVCPAADFASGQVPNTSGGMVEMVKRYSDGSSGRITYWGMRESDGVYEMFITSYPFEPTGKWVYFGQDVDYKIYNSVTDLGLTDGSATLAGAWSAMPNNSILICNISAFSSSECPPRGISVANFYGTIVIIKVISYRGSIYAYGKTVSHGDWRMYLVDGTNVPSGTWVCCPGAVADGTVTKTFSGTFTNDTTWVECDGHLAILNLQVRYTTGFGTDDWTDIYSVSPAPIKAVYSSFNFNGQSATVRVKTDGAVQILGHGSAYTQYARYPIPYFY